jgi:hypothetical protein
MINSYETYFADMPRSRKDYRRLSVKANGIELYEDPNGDGGKRLAIVSNELPAKVVEEIRQILLRELNNIK